MMAKTKFLTFAAIFVTFMVITSMARPDSTLKSKSTEMEKKCETEECLMKKTSDAHVDYIYTQMPPPTLHDALTRTISNATKGVEKECETDECLMKTTSDAHVDYIYTGKRTPPPKLTTLEASP